MDTASEAPARPWVIPAGDSNEHVICVGDDAGKPGTPSRRRRGNEQ